MPWPATEEELPLGVQNDTDAETGEPNPVEYAAGGGTDPEGEGDHAERHNALADGLNRTWDELGVNPSGAQADVAARLAAMDLVLAAAGTSIGAAQAAIEAEVTARGLDVDGEETRAKAAEAANLALIERWVWREGMPEKFWPALNGFRLWKPQTRIPVANEISLLRFEAPRNIVCRGLRLMVVSVATVNDPCAIILKAANGKTNLASSGSVSGKLNGSALAQDIDFTEDVLLEAGKIYYPGFQYGSVGGTAAGLLSAEVQNGNSVGGVFGTSAGTAYVGAATTTFPFVGEPTFATSSNRVYMIVRER
jgi:hypothetical protein